MTPTYANSAPICLLGLPAAHIRSRPRQGAGRGPARTPLLHGAAHPRTGANRHVLRHANLAPHMHFVPDTAAA